LIKYGNLLLTTLKIHFPALKSKRASFANEFNNITGSNYGDLHETNFPIKKLPKRKKKETFFISTKKEAHFVI